MAVVVTEVLPNGYLVISGSQEIRVNAEVRVLQLAGIVNPLDISRRNDVAYDKIAEAQGALSRQQLASEAPNASETVSPIELD